MLKNYNNNIPVSGTKNVS